MLRRAFLSTRALPRIFAHRRRHATTHFRRVHSHYLRTRTRDRVFHVTRNRYVATFIVGGRTTFIAHRVIRTLIHTIRVRTNIITRRSKQDHNRYVIYKRERNRVATTDFINVVPLRRRVPHDYNSHNRNSATTHNSLPICRGTVDATRFTNGNGHPNAARTMQYALYRHR